MKENFYDKVARIDKALNEDKELDNNILGYTHFDCPNRCGRLLLGEYNIKILKGVKFKFTCPKCGYTGYIEWAKDKRSDERTRLHPLQMGSR